ncbi:MAG: class I SAM-dependent methyltransferase [Clostridia bacterium]|nr:class I SAM-dependent methyltransferase [Clostridia bacterium]
MEIADKWTDYEILATGDGMKLERWGLVTLLRPDPQIIWHPQRDLYSMDADAVYERSVSGGGRWVYRKEVPADWNISYGGMTFSLKLMGFKHTGIFPEQAVNWDEMGSLIKSSGREDVSVLNLFAYTGGASVACAKAGAKVTHVDAAKGMVDRAGKNARLSGVDEGIRYIVDDCEKFVQREIRRGHRYDAVIMDPPSYGRGPSGETWKLEDSLYDFVALCARVLKDDPLFVLINSYTTGLSPAVMENILRLTMKDFNGSFDSYEVGLPTREGMVLPCGASGLFRGGTWKRTI